MIGPKKLSFLKVLSAFIVSANLSAKTQCFILKSKDKILIEEGDCKTRVSPCSSFKIPISMMGFDSGVLIDAEKPLWNYQKNYIAPVVTHKKSHTPATWLKDSVVWYSQQITKRLGMQKFQNYVQDFDFGNKDVSGDKGKNNGLEYAWLNSSLKISPEEQIAFLEKLHESKLPVSLKAQEQTRQLISHGTLEGNLKLYGKTGSGYQEKADGSLNRDRKQGWFIGWVEKDGQTYYFAELLFDTKNESTPGGLRAKVEAIEKLSKFLKKR